MRQVLSAALAITLGLLVRALCVRRVPTIRSVIQAEKKRAPWKGGFF